MTNVDSKVKVRKGSDRLNNGQSLKACLPPEIYGNGFHRSKREQEYYQLQQMYKSQNNGKV